MVPIGADDLPPDPQPGEPYDPPFGSEGAASAVQALFEWPVADRTPGTGAPGAPSILRRLDVERLVAVERAAAAISEPVAHFWRGLARSAEAAVTPQSLDTLFRESLRLMSQLLGVHTVAILLANEAGDELVARAAIGLDEEITLGLGIRSGEGMAGRVLASRRPLLVGDLSAIHVVNPVLRSSGLHSVVAVPLLGSERRPLGVLYAASYEIDEFSEADASLLELLADRLAAAIERVRLFDAERSARRHAERLAARIGRMQEVTALLAAVSSAEGAAEALTGALVSEGDDESPWWAVVWLVADGRLVPLRHATRGAPLPPPAVIALDDEVAVARTVREGRPRYFGGPVPGSPPVATLLAGTAEPPPPPDPEQGQVAEPPFDGGAFVALPIPGPDSCFGVLGLAFPGWRPFDLDERQFLEAVVRQASLAFDRARLTSEQADLAALANFFAGAARSLAEAEDLPETLDRLGDLAVQMLGEICLIELLDEEGRNVRMVAKHRDPAEQPLVDRLRTEYAPDPDGVHPAAEVLRSGGTRWSDCMTDDFLRDTTRDAEHFAVTRALGFRSYVTVPIVAGSEVMGTLTSVSCSRPLRPSDVALAEQLARQVAGLVDNARRFDTARRTSRVLQASLLPRDLPTVPGLTIDSRYLPGTRALEVGGDFYDVYLLPSGAVGFAIGDVAGHDRGAAALMGHLRTAARALAVQSSSPGAWVDALRGSWDLLGFDRIATAVFGQLEPESGALAVVSAGHYPPLHKQASETGYLPVVPGPPLGVPGGTAVSWEGTLDPTAILLLYTDGAIDERVAGSDASMAALAGLVAVAPPHPGAVCSSVVESLPPDRVDDVALLAIRLDRPAAPDVPATC